MTRKRAAILLGDPAMATTTAWRNALRQHDLQAIRLVIPGTPAGKTRLACNLVLNVCDGEIATLRDAIMRISNRFQIVAVLPPTGDSADFQKLAYGATVLAEELGLPGFTTSAFTLAANRYLTRCHWQKMRLPVGNFSLIQFPSALLPASVTIGLPVRLSPIHYHLRHLYTHIQREADAPKAYHLIASTLLRHNLNHSETGVESGEDPRTQHHIRFSWMSDMLAVAEPPTTPVETTVLVRDREPQVTTCTPIARRYHPPAAELKKSDITTITDLSIEACKALHIQNGVATCVLQHSADRILLDGIIPNDVDGRLIPAIEASCKRAWPEIMLEAALRVD